MIDSPSSRRGGNRSVRFTDQTDHNSESTGVTTNTIRKDSSQLTLELVIEELSSALADA